MDEYGRDCCIRGYHIYKEVWEAAIGDVLECLREPSNARDRYAVATKKEGNIIGHLPKKISKPCVLFLRRGGSIYCTVTGGRRHSSDLPQGGLEIPCFLVFEAEIKLIKKLKMCIEHKSLV